MKQRTAIHMVLSLAVAVMLIICGTAFQTHYSPDPKEWLRAHQETPLLWLVDFTAVYTLLLMATLARARRRLYRQAEEMYVLREEHHNQLGALIARTTDAEELNEQQAERLEQLEAETRSRQESFEEEARHLVEQMFRSLQGQVEAHTRQLDAVNMALQYHRAELAEVRHHLRGQYPSHEIPSVARLSPAEIAAFNEGLSTQEAFETGSETLSDRSDDSSSSPSAQPALGENAVVFDPTLNAGSTFVLDTAEFDAFSTAPPASVPQNATNE